MGTPGVSLFLKQAHFGRVKGRYWTCHGPTIKASFESSTFINLKQSIDLKAESSKLPERIIKTASLEFGTLQCNLHEAFYCERWPAHLPPVTPCPYSEQLLFLLAFMPSLSQREAVTGESPWGHGSLPPSGSPRERVRKFQARRTTVWSAAASSRRAPGRRGHSWVGSLLRSGCPCEGCEGELKIEKRKFQTSLRYTPPYPLPSPPPHPTPTHYFPSWLEG